MSIAPISPMTIASIAPQAATSAPTGVDAAGATDGKFGNAISGALDNLQGAQNTADNAAVQAASGDLTDIHNYTIASSEASLTTELTVAVRDRAVEAFNEIMRMQI